MIRTHKIRLSPTSDRDLNTALNLRAYGLTHLTGSTESSSESYACGDSSGSGTGLLAGSTSYGSLKQEGL